MEKPHRPCGQKHVRILGTRGIPGGHGGFESWAEELALDLTSRGWAVTVYCQEQGSRPTRQCVWRGIRLVKISVPCGGSLGACLFDLMSTLHAVRERGLVLVLGYNTAVLSLLYRIRGIPNVLNMDGLEWKRPKYRGLERAWLLLNEGIGARVADHLIADHPGIASRYSRWLPGSKITVIPYGARPVHRADARILTRFGLRPREYSLVVARPEPENSLLEIVRAFEASRGEGKLVMVGAFNSRNRYQRSVLEAAGYSVVFPGPVYQRELIDALRFHARLYVHGHTVGGTNPSLVEAMGAGTPVLAHDNRFNRGVAGSAAAYFKNEAECSREFNRLLSPSGDQVLEQMRCASWSRHRMAFNLSERLEQYHRLLQRWATGELREPAPLDRMPALAQSVAAMSSRELSDTVEAFR